MARRPLSSLPLPSDGSLLRPRWHLVPSRSRRSLTVPPHSPPPPASPRLPAPAPAPAPAGLADVLDESQRRAFHAALEGRNVFLTGGPGTGKSFTLQQIIAALRAKHGKEDAVHVVAPTAVAALIAKGQTIHSWPGPGVPHGTTAAFNRMRPRVWREVRCLVLDEVSMVDAEFLDYYMAQLDQPAMQCVFSGDFAQMPPVPSSQGSLSSKAFLLECMRAARPKEEEMVEEEEEEAALDPAVDDGQWDMEKATPFGMREAAGKYAFQTVFWRRAEFEVHQLSAVHRTKAPLLLEALMHMRQGRAHARSIAELLVATRRPLPLRDGIEPTTLYTTRRAVAKENEQQLKQLDAATRHNYDAVDSARVDDRARNVTVEGLMKDAFFTSTCPVPKQLELRVGAQVMLLMNEPDVGEARLVNGSRGVVVGFQYDGEHKDDFPVVRFLEGRVKVVTPEKFEKKLYLKGELARVQVPLALAWALTVHKAQGATIDYLRVDLAGCFVEGQAYVAISRASSLEGLQIVNMQKHSIRTKLMVSRFYAALDAGLHQAFLQQRGLWWGSVILSHPFTKWRHFFCLNEKFRVMVKQLPTAEESDHAERLLAELRARAPAMGERSSHRDRFRLM
ncbi:hypothetical protein AB1Y20_016218 [Prymnesium parvum]|uniref:ATP-dependent DNA helicase n=1 Tax=Prymnesium parvum TaxID=97485 RepID=A0AB34IC43_PRYPA